MSRTITYQCHECHTADTVYSAHDDGWMNYETCKYCELMYCKDCVADHLKKEKV